MPLTPPLPWLCRCTPYPPAFPPPPPEHARVSSLTDYASNPIIVKDLKKIYPGQDGQPPKVNRRPGQALLLVATCWLGMPCMQ